MRIVEKSYLRDIFFGFVFRVVSFHLDKPQTDRFFA